MEENINIPEATFNRDEEPSVPLMKDGDLSDIKTMGGLAALFAAGSIIPYIGFILSLASLVLFLITFYKISVFSGKKSIFYNIGVSYLISFVLGIGLVVFFIVAFMDYIKDFSSNYNYNYIDEDYLFYLIETVKENLLTTIISVLVFIYIITITCAYLWKLTLDKTAVFFNDNIFKTVGILYIVGASTTILCGLGLLVNLAGHIVLAIGFFSLKKEKINR